MFAQMYPRLINRVGEFNPQLFREIKGRLQPRNIMIVSALSIVGQILLFIYFEGLLPSYEGVYNRYCTGEGYDTYSRGAQLCIADMLGNIQTIREVWWLDMFVTMSIMGIFILLLGGSYMLVADLTKEERKGTFNFIRLSPQSASDIFLGKILGVPILLYLFGILAIPLHIWSGLSANVSFPLMVMFYLILGASCLFFYGMSLLFSLVTQGWGNFQAPLASTFIFFFLFSVMGITLESNAPAYTETSVDWFLLFYPGTFLAYLVKSTYLSQTTLGYLSGDALTNLRWYGQGLWQNGLAGGFLILFNYGVWTFWLYQGLKRRFANPLATVISKSQSYLLSFCFIVINLGFALQTFSPYTDYSVTIQVVQVLNLILFLLLIAGLTPSRQSLRDWARFRHENSRENRVLWRDLAFSEKSPPVMAIALNLLIVNLYSIPSLFFFPDTNPLEFIIAIALGAFSILVYASVAQLLMTLKTDKRGLITSITVITLNISPLFGYAFLNDWTKNIDNPILIQQILANLSPLPITLTTYESLSAILISLSLQMVTIVAFNLKMTKTLAIAGMSETKRLMMTEK
ncbi:ABC transporter permease [Cyanobacterium stanieri LEGE 03274]|uniref:ABC transporter permease n=1 Tax=Cyanobacterium stanieri LEGE 03274 TaxID=1828756 RepID=A0ABR9V5F4_9CHRO|nr:ABC transporter permease [Cyanobacterium stanieri]MBE9223112.1 ABC transporter permease [Cyanobacterium stanieri LEGE 03274]